MAIAHDFSCSFSAGGLRHYSCVMQFYECCDGKDHAVGADICTSLPQNVLHALHSLD